MSEEDRFTLGAGASGAPSASSPPQAAALHGRAEGASLPSAPPPAPREVTRAASRRAWHEPHVHFWWIVAIGLVGAALWIAVAQTITWNRDARLIRGGTRVDAVIWPAGARVKGRPIGPEDAMTVEFHWNGEPVAFSNRRLIGRGTPTISGETIPIYVDPQDPTNWTARSSPPSLVKLMVGAFAIVAVAGVLSLVSVLKRRGVLSTWRNGEARQAAVVETSQTALAPRSRLVRCALTDGSDRRLINVCIPHRVAHPQPGDGLWLVMPPGKPDKALAAMMYE